MRSSAEEWEEIKSLFDAALEHPVSERAQFLAENCPEDSIRAEVLSLLRNRESAALCLPSAPLEREARPTRPRLFDGQVLAGRFCIVRFIASGGMGEVYEAQDQELREHVAVKVVRPEILTHPDALSRFKREVHLARQVTHPNVCRVYDLFRDRPQQDDRIQDTVFVSMEMLHGKTLSARLNECKKMSAEEVLPLVRQMAAALHAAHSVGVIHRDFKPGNVVLVKPEGRTRAVVTDFGLALRSAPSDESASISTAKCLLGTPAYMSPEQLEGLSATPASDIYALGLVIYEMVTGARPFHGDTPMSMAFKRVSEKPVSPRELEPALDRTWEATILRCLERNPADRFSNAMEVVEALTGKQTGVSKRNYRLLALTALALIAFLIVGTGFLIRVRRGKLQESSKTSGSPKSSIRTRPSVAVLGFKNLSGSPDAGWLSTTLEEMLSTELAAGEQLRTIPGENVARTKIDLSLPDADSFAKDTLHRLHKNLNADYVIFGSYFDSGQKLGGQIRLDLRLQDANIGETIASLSETGTEDQLLDLVSRTGTVLREKLGVQAVTQSEAGSIRAALPSSPEAARLYAEGLKKLRVFDALGAHDLLQKAIAVEPSYPLSHSALSEAWSRLGYEEKAQEEAKKAFDLSASLSREERLLVEARYQEANQSWGNAAELYRTLFSFFPDNLEYGLRLAGAQQHAGKGRDAIFTLGELRKFPAPARDDPRIDIMEAAVSESLGDFTQEEAAAKKAEEKAKALGAPLLVAEALLSQCWAFHMRGRYEQALNACAAAKESYTRAGDLGGAAAALSSTGTVLSDAGELSEAQRTFEQALAVFNQIGDKSEVALSLNNSANVLAARGDHIGATRHYQEALEMYQQMGNKNGIGLALSNIAAELMLRGELQQANATFRQALTVNRETGSEDFEAGDLAGLGETLYLQGELGDSENTLTQALTICRRIDFKQVCGETLSAIGKLQHAKDSLNEAGSRYQEALAIHKEIAAQIDAAKTRLSLAELSIEEGHAADAADSAADVREEFRKRQDFEDEAWADAVLARALLAQGKSSDAKKEVDRASATTAKLQNEEVRLKFRVAADSIRSASTNPVDLAAATQGLHATLVEAGSHGYLGYELEARLALGEIEMKSGQTSAGRAHLNAVQRNASAKGFSLIAKKAAQSQLNPSSR